MLASKQEDDRKEGRLRHRWGCWGVEKTKYQNITVLSTKYQVPKYQVLPETQVGMEYQNTKASQYQVPSMKESKFQSFKVSKFQSIQISRIPSQERGVQQRRKHEGKPVWQRVAQLPAGEGEREQEQQQRGAVDPGEGGEGGDGKLALWRRTL